MRHAQVTASGAGAALVAVVLLTSQVYTGQTPAPSSSPDSYTMARTPWGDPDIQGIWASGYILTKLERPDEYEGREFLTDEEVESLEVDAANSFVRARPERGLRDLQGAYNAQFSGRGSRVVSTQRTSLIVDPPDGQIPFAAEESQRRAAAAESRRERIGTGQLDETGGIRLASGPEERPGDDRCFGVSLPFRFGVAGASGAHTRIVQTPGHIAVYYEQGHKGGIYRTIFLDGRPRLPEPFRQWLGHASGRWEGDTLVVDTTNFSHKSDYQGSRENLHLVERYTPLGPESIMYHATFEDSTVFARPWTIEVPLTKNDSRENLIYEAACHEGNYALTSILAGARLAER